MIESLFIIVSVYITFKIWKAVFWIVDSKVAKITAQFSSNLASWFINSATSSTSSILKTVKNKSIGGLAKGWKTLSSQIWDLKKEMEKNDMELNKEDEKEKVNKYKNIDSDNKIIASIKKADENERKRDFIWEQLENKREWLDNKIENEHDNKEKELLSEIITQLLNIGIILKDNKDLLNSENGKEIMKNLENIQNGETSSIKKIELTDKENEDKNLLSLVNNYNKKVGDLKDTKNNIENKDAKNNIENKDIEKNIENKDTKNNIEVEKVQNKNKDKKNNLEDNIKKEKTISISNNQVINETIINKMQDKNWKTKDEADIISKKVIDNIKRNLPVQSEKEVKKFENWKKEILKTNELPMHFSKENLNWWSKKSIKDKFKDKIKIIEKTIVKENSIKENSTNNIEDKALKIENNQQQKQILTFIESLNEKIDKKDKNLNEKIIWKSFSNDNIKINVNVINNLKKQYSKISEKFSNNQLLVNQTKNILNRLDFLHENIKGDVNMNKKQLTNLLSISNDNIKTMLNKK